MKLPVDLWQVLVGFLVLLLVARVLVALLPLRVRSQGETRTIRVIGVGGGGCNAVDAMIRARVRGVGFIACNTDVQALRRSAAPRKIQIGEKVTRGLGTGGDPVVGRQAAEADTETIATAVTGSDLVFVAAGLGGGTGSGGAPIVAGIARERGALTIGVVTTPFSFEGPTRATVAERAALELRGHVDALIKVPNDRLNGVVADDASIVDAFRVVDDVLRESVQAIVRVITVPGLVNLDFADVRAVLKDGGTALIGIGRASGENRAIEAAHQAIANPLVEHGIEGARQILMSVAGSPTLRLTEVARAAETIREVANPAANMIFGTEFDEGLGDAVRIMVLATGFDQDPTDVAEPALTVAGRIQGPDEPAPAQRPVIGAEGPRGKRKAVPRPDAKQAAASVRTHTPGGGQPAKTERPALDPDLLEVPSFLRETLSKTSEKAERTVDASRAHEEDPPG